MASNGLFRLRTVPVLSDVVVIFISSIVVLIPNGQFLGCASSAFSALYQMFVIRQLQNISTVCLYLM